MNESNGRVKFADLAAGDLFGFDNRFYIKTVGRVEGPNGGTFHVVYDLTFMEFDVFPEADLDELVFPGNQEWFNQFASVERVDHPRPVMFDPDQTERCRAAVGELSRAGAENCEAPNESDHSKRTE